MLGRFGYAGIAGWMGLAGLARMDCLECRLNMQFFLLNFEYCIRHIEHLVLNAGLDKPAQPDPLRPPNIQFSIFCIEYQILTIQ